jgi:hypothetical protein
MAAMKMSIAEIATVLALDEETVRKAIPNGETK